MMGRLVPQHTGVDAMSPSNRTSRKVLGNACSNNKTLLKNNSSKTLLIKKSGSQTEL